MKVETLLKGNTYPGRGFIVGMTEDGRAMFAYFLMGRSKNSRNRLLREVGRDIRTEPFDPADVRDPSLIIYRAVADLGERVIVSNGDQTDTIVAKKDFVSALETREYEPDAPNYTARISAVLHFSSRYHYVISILRRTENGSCERPYWKYYGREGTGHLIHTYEKDSGGALPPFAGAPREVEVEGSLPAFAGRLWDSLDAENRISLVARAIDPKDGKSEQVLINKHIEGAAK